MTIRSKFTARPLGLVASATLAIAVVGVLPAEAAFADGSPVSPSATVADRTLVIEGTDEADTITAGVGADPSQFRVTFGAAAPAQTFDRSAFGAIFVSLGRGDDSFSVDSQGQFNDTPLTVHGGKGDDTIRGSNGNDVIAGGAGNDDIDGGKGADTELLGSGNDTALWLPGEGSDVVVGGGGHDALTFIGNGAAEHFGLTAAGSHAILTRDLGTITMDTDGVEVFNVAALGGPDTINVGDLSGTHLRTANLDLSSAGAPDGQLDTVTVNGTDDADHVSVDAAGAELRVRGLHTQTNISGNDVRDLLQIHTGAGDDSVQVSDAAAALISTAVDLGADQS